MKTKYTPKGWGKMTNAQKRVEIAKDVIKQIHAKLYRVGESGFISLGPNDFSADVQGDQVVDHLDEVNPGNCGVCALGGLMLSRIRFENNLAIRELGLSGRDIRFALGDIFTRKMLSSIEAAFEAWFDSFWDAERDFHDSHGNHEDRLIAIMQNIIDHRGTFKSEVLYTVELK